MVSVVIPKLPTGLPSRAPPCPNLRRCRRTFEMRRAATDDDPERNHGVVRLRSEPDYNRDLRTSGYLMHVDLRPDLGRTPWPQRAVVHDLLVPTRRDHGHPQRMRPRGPDRPGLDHSQRLLQFVTHQFGFGRGTARCAGSRRS